MSFIDSFNPNSQVRAGITRHYSSYPHIPGIFGIDSGILWGHPLPHIFLQILTMDTKLPVNTTLYGISL